MTDEPDIQSSPTSPPPTSDDTAATPSSPSAYAARETTSPSVATTSPPAALETTPEHLALELTPQPAALEPTIPEVENQTAVSPEVAPTPTRKRKSRTPSPSGSTRRRKAESAVPSKKEALDTQDASAAPSPAETTDQTAVSPSGIGSNKKWYVIKVASGREESIKSAIERKIKIEGLEPYFGQIVIPYEELVLKKTVKVKDKKTGEMVTQEKKTIKKQKKFPGYLFAELEINDRILYLFRETSGVGDFVGARGARRVPTPMTEREVQQILTGVVLPGDRKKLGPRQIVKLDFEKGDKVRIREGAFANMEGEVKAITEVKEEGDTPKVTVQVTVFGRPVDVTLDYWQVDKA
jgi:transcriptional antiterminator NusG